MISTILNIIAFSLENFVRVTMDPFDGEEESDHEFGDDENLLKFFESAEEFKPKRQWASKNISQGPQKVFAIAIYF